MLKISIPIAVALSIILFLSGCAGTKNLYIKNLDGKNDELYNILWLSDTHFKIDKSSKNYLLFKKMFTSSTIGFVSAEQLNECQGKVIVSWRVGDTSLNEFVNCLPSGHVRNVAGVAKVSFKDKDIVGHMTAKRTNNYYYNGSVWTNFAFTKLTLIDSKDSKFSEITL